jgi:hypothetical protein
MNERHDADPAKPEVSPQPNELLELIELQESFGFVETPELSNLHAQILDAVGDEYTNLRHQLTGEYQDTAIAIIGDDPPDDLRHGFALAVAVIKLEAGYDFASLDDMQDVLEGMRYVPKYVAQVTKLDKIMRAIETGE